MLGKLRSELRREPIILAHHPLCGKFDDHFFIIKGRKVCRGCLTVYPTAAAALLVLYLTGYSDFTGLFFLALGLFFINLARLVIHRSEISNMAFNMILGACLATVVFSFRYCPSELLIYYASFVLITYLAFMSYRGARMLNGCRRCPNYKSFPACCTRGDKV